MRACNRPDSSVGGLGSARLLLASRWREPGYRNGDQAHLRQDALLARDEQARPCFARFKRVALCHASDHADEVDGAMAFAPHGLEDPASLRRPTAAPRERSAGRRRASRRPGPGCVWSPNRLPAVRWRQRAKRSCGESRPDGSEQSPGTPPVAAVIDIKSEVWMSAVRQRRRDIVGARTTRHALRLAGRSRPRWVSAANMRDSSPLSSEY